MIETWFYFNHWTLAAMGFGYVALQMYVVHIVLRVE